MIHISLGPERRRGPGEDALGRDRVGYREGMSQEELYYANHGTWVIGVERRSERFALFSFRGEVKQAVEIKRIYEKVHRNPEDSKDHRCVIEGDFLRSGHPVYDTYVGKQSPVGPTRNPVRYFVSPLDVQRPCRCGCGEPVAGRDFVQGHDQAALHARVQQIGTVAEFLDWFDVVRGHRPVSNPDEAVLEDEAV